MYVLKKRYLDMFMFYLLNVPAIHVCVKTESESPWTAVSWKEKPQKFNAKSLFAHPKGLLGKQIMNLSTWSVHYSG